MGWTYIKPPLARACGASIRGHPYGLRPRIFVFLTGLQQPESNKKRPVWVLYPQRIQLLLRFRHALLHLRCIQYIRRTRCTRLRVARDPALRWRRSFHCIAGRTPGRGARNRARLRLCATPTPHLRCLCTGSALHLRCLCVSPALHVLSASPERSGICSGVLCHHIMKDRPGSRAQNAYFRIIAGIAAPEKLAASPRRLPRLYCNTTSSLSSTIITYHPAFTGII